MWKNYLKIGWKVLLRRKFYTFISLFGIAFTLVVLMVAASLMDHIFGACPPENKAERSLGIYAIEARGKHIQSSNLPGWAFLDRYVRTMKTPEKISFHSAPSSVLSFLNGRRIESYLKRTDGAFWEIMEFRFLEGGPFTEKDNRDRNFVAVINDSTRRRFFGLETAVGKWIEADNQRFRVIGVVADVSHLRITPFADIWVPVTTAKTAEYRERFFGGFMATLLARDKAGLAAIQEEYRILIRRVEPPEPRFDVVLGSLDSPFGLLSRILISQDLQKNPRPGVLMAWLLGFAGLFMLLPAINLVNINVSRIMERASEIGVRKSFGASSRTLVGQFVVENVVLTLIGGAVGLVLSLAVLRMIEAADVVRYARFGMNYRVFLCGLAFTLFFGLFSGVYPAWKMSRMHPVDALRGGSL
jgi:putative ABC transport system permease protein